MENQRENLLRYKLKTVFRRIRGRATSLTSACDASESFDPMARSAAKVLSEHGFYSFPPALVNTHEFPLDVRRNVTQQHVGGGMNVQSRCHKIEERRFHG